MELFEVEEVTVSEWAFREGMVLDAIGRHDPADWSDDPFAIRRASVQALARRCSWPEAHSRHVAMLALELFDQLRELHGLDDDDRELLEYAALLHDIGEHVAHEGHDRHAAYLVHARPPPRAHPGRDHRAHGAGALAPPRRSEGERRSRRRARRRAT